MAFSTHHTLTLFLCLILNMTNEESRGQNQIRFLSFCPPEKRALVDFKKIYEQDPKKEENNPDLLLMLLGAIWQETKPAVNLPSRKNATPLLVVTQRSAVL